MDYQKIYEESRSRITGEIIGLVLGTLIQKNLGLPLKNKLIREGIVPGFEQSMQLKIRDFIDGLLNELDQKFELMAAGASRERVIAGFELQKLEGK